MNNKHKYGSIEETMAIRKTCTKGSKMNCWESLSIQIHQQQEILIEEQKANDFNPIYALVNVTGLYRDRITKTGSHCLLSRQQAIIQETS
jgi:hypothetical protein